MLRLLPPIVALDIDGTIGVYHEHFRRFAAEWVGRELPGGFMGNVPFHKHLGLSKQTYRKCKLAYRRGGLKRSMPHYAGSRQLSVEARRAGAKVFICTTRPFLSLDDVEPDTVHNLKRHGVQYDYIISGEHKYRDLLKIVNRSQVVMVLEDQDDMLSQALSLGLPAVRARHAHNDVSKVEVEAEVHDLSAAKEVALARIKLYKQGNWVTK